MKFVLLFLVWTIPKLLIAQTDSMLVELQNGSVKSYAVSTINQLTFGGGTITDVKDLETIGNILSSFTLKQNYPNPFNPTTMIEYEIPHSGDVEIAIFDMQGRRVRELENSSREAGSYRTVWDSRDDIGRNVSSGTYFCRIVHNGSQLVSKLLLLK